MAQFARPDADIVRTGWAEDDDTTDALFAEIDESSPNDADYIKSPTPPGTNVYVCSLSNVVDPVSSVNHVVRVRARKQPTGGATIDLLVELRQGYVNEGSQGTLINTRTIAGLTDTFVTDADTLSGAEADAITNYSDLFLRFVASQS